MSSQVVELFQTREQFRSELRKVKEACRQVALLNKKVAASQIRYKRALRQNRKTFCYTMRMSIATIESIRSMFYEYADRKARCLYKVSRQYQQTRIQQLQIQSTITNEGRNESDDVDTV